MKYRYLIAGVTALSLCLASLFPLFAFATTDTYTASGSWVAPTGVTSVTVDVWAGGGGGGSGSGGGAGGGGGGGGAFSEQTGITVVPGNSYTVTVGTGGTGQVFFGAASTAGGDSWFSTTGTVLAKGGTGAGAGVGAAGGVAASGVGTTKWSGGLGGSDGGVGSGDAGAGGGGGGGTTGNGGTGQNSSGTCTPGIGGTGTSVGGGNGGDGKCSGIGGTGSTKGGGGGGTDAGETGGVGARGEVQIIYTAAAASTPAPTSQVNIANGSVRISNGSIIIK